MYRELSEVCEKWGLVEMERSIVPSSRRDSSTGSTTSSVSNAYDRSTTASPTPSEYHDQSLVLTLMSTTTAAIRAAQKYFLSLPADKLSGVSELSNMPTGGPAKSPSGGPPVLGVSTASRPIPRQSTMGIASPNRSATSPEGLRSATNQSRGSAKDPLLRLRKASLATLGSLKEMGHRYRLLPSKQDSDMKDVEESLGDLSITSSASSIANPSFQIEDTSVSEQSGESDSRKGHLYRTDVSLRDLNQEAQVVKEWVETVNDLLTHVSSESKTSRVRTRSGNLSSDNSPLPNWARSDAYGGDRLCK